MSESSQSLARQRPPMWARWVLSLAVAAALLTALIIFVDRHNSNGPASQNPKAVAQANREAEIVVAQDQAPHVVVLNSASDPRAAFVAAVRADMSGRINRGTIDGTLQRVTCARAGQRAGTLAYDCTAVVADVNYPYLGVIDLAARRLTYCKRDEPPVPSQNIPVSSRCEL
jgi:hypothetical protein